MDEYVAQHAHIVQQIVAMNSLPAAKRRQYELFVLRCQGCEERMLEVMETSPYHSVRHRKLASVSVPTPPVTATDDERRQFWVNHFRSRDRAIRREPWRTLIIETPVPVPENVDPATEYRIACKCRDGGTVSLRWIARKMHAGKKSARWPRNDR